MPAIPPPVIQVPDRTVIDAVPARMSHASDGPASCLPRAVVRGTKVVALSAYQSSGAAMPFQLAGSSYPVHQLTVSGRATYPVVLVLTAYQPLLWDVSAIHRRIKAVVASGYYPQAVRGLDPATPIRFSSSVGTFRAGETCSHIDYAYDSTADVQKMASGVQRAIGASPRIFYGAYSTDRFDVDGPADAGAGPVDLSDVKASVPFITEDDPASSARMRTLSSQDERLAPRVVEWDATGTIIRDEGGQRSAFQGSGTSIPPQSAYERRRSSGSPIARTFAWLCLGAFALWAWRRARERPGPDAPAAPAHDEQVPAMQAIAQPSPPSPRAPFEKQFAELAALATLTDSQLLVFALHHFGRALHGLARTRFDPDLHDEISAIVERHFEHAIERFREVRPFLTGTEAERADMLLTPAIERLTDRLHELRAEQGQRDVSGVDEAARFIDARHPH